MRRMVAIRENGLCRRQTDDEHRGSAQMTRTVRLRFCVCGYYELSVRTDESSANTSVLQYLRLMNWVKGHRWRRLSVATTGPAPNSQHTAWICIKEMALWDWPKQSHIFFMAILWDALAYPFAVSVTSRELMRKK